MKKLELNIFLLLMTEIVSEQECTNTTVKTLMQSGIILGYIIAIATTGIEINLLCGLF